mgnify:CR=1 FL=1
MSKYMDKLIADLKKDVLYGYTLRKLSSDPLAINSIIIIHGRSVKI